MIAQRRSSSHIAVFLFALWAVAILVLGSALTALHQPVHTSADAVSFVRSVVGEKNTSQGRYSIVHVLAADCGCSRKVWTHLERAPRTDDAVESVILVGTSATGEAASPPSETLRARGIRVFHVNTQQIRIYPQPLVVPLLVILDQNGKTAYAGGYAARSVQSVEPEDRQIFERVRHEERVPPFPIFGCAVSRRLRDQLDPLGLKYAWWKQS